MRRLRWARCSHARRHSDVRTLMDVLLGSPDGKDFNKDELKVGDRPLLLALSCQLYCSAALATCVLGRGSAWAGLLHYNILHYNTIQ